MFVPTSLQIRGDVVPFPAIRVVIPGLGVKRAPLQRPPNRGRGNPVDPCNFIKRQDQWQGGKICNGDRNGRDNSGTWHDGLPLHKRAQADADGQYASLTMLYTLNQPGAVETEFK